MVEAEAIHVEFTAIKRFHEKFHLRKEGTHQAYQIRPSDRSMGIQYTKRM